MADGREREPVHELSNHLTVIIGFAELLLENLGDDDERRADILEIRAAAEAALALIPQLR
jgi:signal transduction histidine kinase